MIGFVYEISKLVFLIIWVDSKYHWAQGYAVGNSETMTLIFLCVLHISSVAVLTGAF